MPRRRSFDPEEECKPAKNFPLKSGESHIIEGDADKILAKGRRGVTSMSEKTSYLSREQLLLRQSKEIYNEQGVPDGRLISGIYRRAYNPQAGKRPRGLKNGDDG